MNNNNNWLLLNDPIDPLDSHATKVDQAVKTYTREVERLHLPDGKKKYADEEHERRKTEALAPLQAAVELAQDAAREAMERAERDQEAASSDPSAWLTSDELATANSRALFVSEDAKRLPLSDLTKRGQQVLDSKDKVSIFLHARYLGQRADEMMAAGRQEDEQALRAGGIFGRHTSSTRNEGLSELLEVVQKLNDAATPKEVKQRAASAKALQKHAQELHYHAVLQLQEADGSLARAREEFARNVRYNF